MGINLVLFLQDKTNAISIILPLKTIVSTGFLLIAALFLKSHAAYAQSTPGCPQVSLISATACDTSWVDLGTLVRDYTLQADVALFFDADPVTGVPAFAQTGFRSGLTFPSTSGTKVQIGSTRTFWVVIIDTSSQVTCSDTGFISIPFRPKPTLGVNIAPQVCPGDTVPSPIFSSVQSGSLLFWEKISGDPDLPRLGFGAVPAYQAKPNREASTRYDSIRIFAWRNGCLSDSVFWTPSVKPAPSLEPLPPDTVCANTSFDIELNTHPVAGNTIFQWGHTPSSAILRDSLLSDRVSFDDYADFRLVQYPVIPVTNGCKGDTGIAEIIVKTAPFESGGTPDTVCSGDTWEYLPASFSMYPTAIRNWRLVTVDSQLIFRNAFGTNAFITDTLANPGQQMAEAQYEIIPIGNNGCPGPADTSTVFVRPQAAISTVDTVIACAGLNDTAIFDLSVYANLFEDRNLLFPVKPSQTYASPSDTLYSSRAQAGDCPLVTQIILHAVSKPTAPRLPAQYFVCDNEVLNLQPGNGDFFFYNLQTGQRILPISHPSLRLPANSSPSLIGISRELLGCEGEIAQGNIVLLPSPSLQASSNSPVCENETLTLDANGAFLYIWTGPQQFYSTFEDPLLSAATTNLSGQYQVIGINQFGCRDTAFEQVQVLAFPDPGLDTSIVICSRDPQLSLFDMLGGNPDPGGVWAGPSALRGGDLGLFDPSTSNDGFYTYSVAGTVACQTPQTAFVRVTVKHDLVARIEGDTLAPLGGSARLRGSGGVSYAWTGPNGFFSTVPSPTIWFNDSSDAGNFQLIVSSPGGCSDTASHSVIARDTNQLFVRVSALLEGARDDSSLLMHDFLRQKSLIPLQEPFTARGWFLSEGQGKTIEPSLTLQTGADAPVHWVVVALRLPQNPDSQWRAVPGILLRNGAIVDRDGTSAIVFSNTPPGDYLVMVHHRNHLNAISRDSLYFSWRSPAVVDFTDPQFPTWGDPHARIVVGGRSWLFAGDADGNGEVQVVDDLFEWRKQVGQGGYLNADYNLDGQVQNSDRLYLWKPNVGRGAFVD